MVALLVVVLVLILLGGWLIGVYNSIVTKRNAVQNAWAQIDTVLKRKANLIPDLVAMVKEYMRHENELLTRITEARASLLRAAESKDVEAAAKADAELRRNLLALFNSVTEAYPDLKANAQFDGMREEVIHTENLVTEARRAYNDHVTIYHNALDTFPGLLLAGRFERAKFFEITEEERRSADTSLVKF